MKRGIDIKLNVRPIFLSLVHQTVFEGPCRFGHDEELEMGLRPDGRGRVI